MNLVPAVYGVAACEVGIAVAFIGSWLEEARTALPLVVCVRARSTPPIITILSAN